MGDLSSPTDRVVRLLADYCRFVDGRRGDEWQALFVEGGRMIYGDSTTQGAGALRDFAVASPEGMHLTGLPVIEPSDDGSSVSVTAPFTFVRADGSQLIAGYYHDQLVDDGSVMRFLERRVELTSRVALPLSSNN